MHYFEATDPHKCKGGVGPKYYKVKCLRAYKIKYLRAKIYYK